MFYRDLISRTAQEMRNLGEEEKKEKHRSALDSYREKVLQIAHSIVDEEKEKGTGLEAAVIIGSIARGTHHLQSDLDLYLIVSDEQIPNTVQTVRDKVQVEMFRSSYNQIKEKISEDPRLMFLFKDGLTVYDGDKGFGRLLVEEAKNMYQSGVNGWTHDIVEKKKEEFILARSKVTKLIERDKVTAMLILERYTIAALEVFYNLRGVWQPPDHEVMKDLQEKNPQFAAKLEHCLQQWQVDYRVKDWLTLIDMAFEPAGGLASNQ